LAGKDRTSNITGGKEIGKDKLSQFSREGGTKSCRGGKKTFRIIIEGNLGEQRKRKRKRRRGEK